MKGIYLICVLSMMFIVGCSASKSVKSPTTQLEGIEAVTESPQKAALYLLDTFPTSIPIQMEEIVLRAFKEEISNDTRMPLYYREELNHDLTLLRNFYLANYIDMYRYYSWRFHSKIGSFNIPSYNILSYKVLVGNHIEKYLSYKSFKGELVSIYASHFTESELRQLVKFYYTTLGMTPEKSKLEFVGKRDQLVEFYSTPLGKKAQKVMPEFKVQMTQLAESRVKDNLGELVIMLEEESKSLPSGLDD